MNMLLLPLWKWISPSHLFRLLTLKHDAMMMPMEQHQRRWLGKKSLLWPYGWLWLAAWWHDNIILTKKQNTWFLVIIMQDIRRPDRWRMEFKIQGKCWTFLIFFAITFMHMRKIGKSRTIQPTNPFFILRESSLMYKISSFVGRSSANIQSFSHWKSSKFISEECAKKKMKITLETHIKTLVVPGCDE